MTMMTVKITIIVTILFCGFLDVFQCQAIQITLTEQFSHLKKSSGITKEIVKLMLKLVMESNGFPSFDNQSHGWVLTASSHIEITGNGSPYEIIWYAVTLNKDPISTLTNYNSPLILRNLTVIPLSLDQMTQNASLNTSIPLDDETNTVAIVGDYLGDDQVPDRQPSFCDFLSPIKPTDPWTWPLEFENMSDPQGLQLPQLDAANLSDIADYVVRKHNCLRTKVTPSAANMLRMEWNQEAADQAQLWANQCHYGHSNETGRTTSNFMCGQNIAYTTPWPFSWNSVINMWYSEYKEYKFGAPNDLHLVGHYTAITWATTFQLGCAYTDCGNWHYYVCHYCPTGNFGDLSSPYKTGKPCQDCSESCDRGLCKNHCMYSNSYSNCDELEEKHKICSSSSQQPVADHCKATCLCRGKIYA